MGDGIKLIGKSMSYNMLQPTTSIWAMHSAILKRNHHPPSPSSERSGRATVQLIIQVASNLKKNEASNVPV